MKRPLFSIVVPMYNSRNYIERLLDSIKNQECASECEVILCDDCSTEPCYDLVRKYKSDLNIIELGSDINHGYPYWGRQTGADYASGEWITFMDHDDEWVENGLDCVKKVIEDNEPKYVIYTKFQEALNGEILSVYNNDNGWTHGKFFNKDNFWDAYNICYYDQVNTYEDVALMNLISFIQIVYDLNYLAADLVTYQWNFIEDSISRSQGGIGHFYETYEYFLNATIKIWIEECEKLDPDTEVEKLIKLRDYIMDCWTFQYFYNEALRFAHLDLSDEIITQTKDYFKRFKELFGFTLDNIFGIVCSDGYIEEFGNQREFAFKQYHFIEQKSIIDFLYELDDGAWKTENENIVISEDDFIQISDNLGIEESPETVYNTKEL